MKKKSKSASMPYFQIRSKLGDSVVKREIDLANFEFCFRAAVVGETGKTVSMTQLLSHTIAHFTGPSFMLKANNQPYKKNLGLEFS